MRTGRLNRVVLTVLGLLLTVGGALALARGLGAFGAGSAHEPLLTSTERRYAATHGWFWPAVAALGAVSFLLAVRWLLAQLRTVRVRELSLEPDRSQGGTYLPTAALTAAVVDDVEGYRGVRRARARLVGDPTEPQLELSVELERHAEVGAVRTRIETHAVPRLRQATERPGVPAVLRLRVHNLRRGT